MSEKIDKRTEKRKVGDAGEDLACVFLVKQGFVIVERNYLRKWGEIDIIARKGQKLHFVEVKTVSHLPHTYFQGDGTRETSWYSPEDNLHPWKLKRLSRAIQTYLLGYRGVSHVTWDRNMDVDWQFDVITVYLDPRTGDSKVEYLEDIIL
jgi:Holliday junction resolvase-like predicted endonuclease